MKKRYQRSAFRLRSGLLAGCAFLIGILASHAYHTTLQTSRSIQLKGQEIQVYFSPGGNCIHALQQTIAQAKKSILVQAYALTSIQIAEALIKAHERGVSVKILIDRSQLTAKGSQITKLKQAGIILSIDMVPGIAHNKIMVIDDDYVITGSYNWSNAAEYKNAENLLIIRNATISEIYKENWSKRAATAIKIH